jgi:hypothetical protein
MTSNHNALGEGSRFPVAKVRGCGTENALAVGLAIVVLVGAGLVRWWGDVGWDQPHRDELAYIGAVEALARGGSPYDAPSFVYNPPFAVLLGSLSRAFGMETSLRMLRTLGLLGLAGLVWASLSLTRWRYGTRLAVGLAIVVASPLVAFAQLYGNVSLLFGALPVVALAVAPRHPWLGGALLGFATGCKPMAVPAIAVLLGAPSTPLRRAGVTSLVATGFTLLIGVRFLPDLLQRAGGLPHLHYNTSLSRALYCFGLTVSPIILLGATSLLAGYLAWRLRVDWRGALLLGSSLSLLAIPSATAHTYVLAYPAVLAAIDRFLGQPRPRSIITGGLVLLGGIAVHSVQGVGTLGDLPLPAQGVMNLIVVLAAPALALWVIHEDRLNA